MAGQAKLLTPESQRKVMALLAMRSSPTLMRDRVLLLLSWRAGLRIGEIAQLEWSDVTDADGRLAGELRVRRLTTKGRTSTRYIPLHPELYRALQVWRNTAPSAARTLAQSHGSKPPTANALTVWLFRLYRDAGLNGCSSHSGRRTFVTLAARRCGDAGASLEDVRQLAGHANLATTAAYIDPSYAAKARLVEMAAS